MIPSENIPNKPRTSHLRSIAPVEQAVAQGTSATEWLVQGVCKQTSHNPSNKRSHKAPYNPFAQGRARVTPHAKKKGGWSFRARTSVAQATNKRSYKPRTRGGFSLDTVLSVVQALKQGLRTRSSHKVLAQGLRTSLRTKRFTQASHNLEQRLV